MLVMFCTTVIILVVCCCCLRRSKKINRRARQHGPAPIIGYAVRGQNVFMVPAGQQPGGMMLVQGVPQVNNSPLINWSSFPGSHDSESGTPIY